MNTSLADRIIARIEELGLSKADAARRCGLEYQEFLRLTGGHRSTPRLPTIKSLAEGLGVSADYIIGIEGASCCTKDVSQ